MPCPVQPFQCKPFREAFHSTVLLERDTALSGKCVRRKRHFENCQYLMSKLAFMGVDVLHESRLTDNPNRYPKFFLKFSDDSRLCRFTKLDRAAKRANALQPPSIIINFACKEAVASPLQAQGFEADARCWAPCVHENGTTLELDRPQWGRWLPSWRWDVNAAAA